MQIIWECVCTWSNVWAIGPIIWDNWSHCFGKVTRLFINVCNVNLLLFFFSIMFGCFPTGWVDVCNVKWSVVRENYPCNHYGISPLLTPNRYCSHLLMMVWITFALYLKFIIVGLNCVHYGGGIWPIWGFTLLYFSNLITPAGLTGPQSGHQGQILYCQRPSVWVVPWVWTVMLMFSWTG